MSLPAGLVKVCHWSVAAISPPQSSKKKNAFLKGPSNFVKTHCSAEVGCSRFHLALRGIGTHCSCWIIGNQSVRDSDSELGGISISFPRPWEMLNCGTLVTIPNFSKIQFQPSPDLVGSTYVKMPLRRITPSIFFIIFVPLTRKLWIF